MNTTTALPETTFYEVAWGIDETDRQTYADNGDGSPLSTDAEARATRAWMNLVKQGVRAGFFVNGEHKAGHDFAEEWSEVEEGDSGAVQHKTRTFRYDNGTHMNWRKVQIVSNPLSWAACACGWKVLQDNRELARRAARVHREG